MSPEAIRAELEVVLGSEVFATSRRHSRFLRQVVELTLSGDLDRLKEYALALDVFDRPAEFDPRADPVVRVEARQLRMRLAQYYESAGQQDPVIISMPKGAYRAEFAMRELPVALPAPAAPVPPKSSRRLAVAVGAAIAIIGAGLYFWLPAKRAADPPAGIAVLPFADHSEPKAGDYLSDEVTDELNDLLSRLRPLRVIARGSVLEVRKASASSTEIGRRLGVDVVLSGSIKRAGERVRVLAQLEQIRDGSIVWSFVFERPVTELPAIRQELVKEVGVHLGIDVGQAANLRRTSVVAEAQSHYLRGRYAAEPMNQESLRESIREFEAAVQVDPQFAAAWCSLAMAKDRLSRFSGNQAADYRPTAALYRKALALDPNLAEARSGIALIKMQHEWDWKGAEAELRTLLGARSDALGEAILANLLVLTGRPQLAEAHVERARGLDPFGLAVRRNAAVCDFLSGRAESADRQYQQLIEMWPSFTSGPLERANVLASFRPKGALPIYRQMAGKIAGSTFLEAAAMARAGQTADAQRLLEKSKAELGGTKVPKTWVAAAEAALGNEDEAMRLLEESAEAREGEAIHIAVSPWFQSLRGHARFRALLGKMGLAR